MPLLGKWSSLSTELSIERRQVSYLATFPMMWAVFSWSSPMNFFDQFWLIKNLHSLHWFCNCVSAWVSCICCYVIILTDNAAIELAHEVLHTTTESGVDHYIVWCTFHSIWLYYTWQYEIMWFISLTRNFYVYSSSEYSDCSSVESRVLGRSSSPVVYPEIAGYNEYKYRLGLSHAIG